MAERKNGFPGFIGPSNVSRAARYDCQRTVNMYLELAPSVAALPGVPLPKGEQPATLIGTPGKTVFADLGLNYPIRGLYTLSASSDLAYVVCSNLVFLISSTAPPLQLTGYLQSSSGTVQMIDNGQQLIIVDGVAGYYVNVAVGTVDNIIHPIVSANFFPTQTVTFQDSYFIGVERATQGMFVSNPNNVTFPALNVAFKEGSPDILVSAQSINRVLYMFGAKSFEVWWDAGQSSVTPFQRQDGRNSQFGCLAPFSICKLGDSFCWLGQTDQGTGMVFSFTNAVPTRISTNAVEFALQSYGDLSGSTAYAYQQEGHFFYCLNCPGANTTWVYDGGTQLWSERQSVIDGVMGRDRAEGHCMLNGQHIVGDYLTGTLYVLDLDAYTENGAPIYRIRQSPHVSNNLNGLFYRLLELDFQFGVGDNSNPSPTVTLQLSRDGGQTFGVPMDSSLGPIGSWLTRCRFQMLGWARDMVARITVTAPVKVQMLSAYLDYEPGNE